MHSSYPADKIVVSCDKCGLHRRLDKLPCWSLAAIGWAFHLMISLAALTAVSAKRRPISAYKCGNIYPELVGLMKAAGKYPK